MQSSISEIRNAAGGVLRVKGDLLGTGKNPGGTWGAVERGETGDSRIT